MRYDFSKMDADSFELMVRSLNEKIFGIKCQQYGLGPDGQREFTYEGEITDGANKFSGKTYGQVKYKYNVTKRDDYTWLEEEIAGELQRFREKEPEYIPDNYLFYTNIVLTPMKDKGVKDKINKYIENNNDIISNFMVLGYDEICTMLDNNRDVAVTYMSHIVPGDVLVKCLEENKYDYAKVMQKYLARELGEEMYSRLDQAGSLTEKKISIEKVCVDIDVIDREENKTVKFAQKIIELGNGVLGYKKETLQQTGDNPIELDKNENFVLIGGPGRGKTTICQFIAQIYRANFLQETQYRDYYSKSFIQEIRDNYGYEIKCKRVPFKITLNEYAAWISKQEKDEDISVIRYMQMKIKKIEGDELSITNMRQMLSQLAWIFFFDGLDEVPESSNRKEVLREIENFIQLELRENCCDCIIVSTTRMEGYNDDFNELKYKHLEVGELSRCDCKKYVKKLFEVMEEQTEKREEYLTIMHEALEDETTSRLMKTPLQATIISILVKSGGKPPHERYSLFHQYYETMVKREKQKGINATLNDNTDWIEEIHLLIANRLQCESECKDNPSAEISRENLLEAICQYIEENKDDYYEEEDKLEKKAEEFLYIITKRICFLCEHKEGLYSFPIRTMQEYFAGTYLVKDVLDEDAMKNITRIAYKSYWRNVLLFALGYIELEKKALEAKVYELCETMNGKEDWDTGDNTANSICLFGTWLAVDILSEDIFKGKKQNRYVEMAAKAVEIEGCAQSVKFAFLSGVQCNKLLAYIRKYYIPQHQFYEGILTIYIRLSENDKNDLGEAIEELLEQCDAEQRLAFVIRLLTEGSACGEELINRWQEILLDYIREDKVKEQLPAKLLFKLINSGKAQNEKTIERFLFLQALYHKNMTLEAVRNGLGINEEINLTEIQIWLNDNRFNNRKIELEITGNFLYTLSNRIPKKETIIKFKSMVECLEINYLVKLCEFVMEPRFDSYLELVKLAEAAEGYFSSCYKSNLTLYHGIDSEESLHELLQDIEEIKKSFSNAGIKELMRRDSCATLGFSVRHGSDLYKNLLEQGPYDIEHIEELGKGFFESYLFVLQVEMKCIREIESWNQKDAENIIRTLELAVKRQAYRYNVSVVMIVILASKYRSMLLDRVPVPYLDTELMEREMKSTKSLMGVYKILADGMVERAISGVVNYVVSKMQENDYLQLITLLLRDAKNITSYVTNYALEELDKIACNNPLNELAIRLLELCMKDNLNLKETLEGILSLEIERQTLYMILVHTICENSIPCGEQALVEVYHMLNKEVFDEKNELRNNILNVLCERISN